MTPDSNLFLFIGKQVKDEYERVIGKVASLAVNPNGRISSIYIEKGDGRFFKHPTESLKVNGSEVIFQSKTKMETRTLCDQIPLIWRKDQALKELVGKEKISPEVYEDMHNSFEGVLNQLRSEAQVLMEKIDKEIARSTKETRELNYALVHLELEHEIGKIDEESYETAFSTIQDCLKSISKEKNDLETMKSKLSNILLGEATPKTEQKTEEKTTEESTQEVPTPPSSSLPEPPVVVYVKEVGETGLQS